MQYNSGRGNREKCAPDIFRRMPSNHYEKVLDQGIHLRLLSPDILFNEGDIAQTCYLVTKGCMKLSKLNAQGGEVIIRYIFPGKMIAALAVLEKEIYPVTAQAIQATEVIAWDKANFINMMYKYPDIAFNLLLYVFDRLEDLQARYLELSTEQVEQRIARLLLNLVEPAEQQKRYRGCIDIPLGRQDIANYIGASMYTVSRILSGWEKSGWLKSSRQKIIITDFKALSLFRDA